MTLRSARAQLMQVSGTIRVPGDKSISHRALMFAAMARGASRVRGLLRSQDVESTARVLRQLGANIPALSDDFVIEGVGFDAFGSPQSVLDCGNSGTTVRLMMGIIAGLAERTATFDGDESLRRRPMKRVAAPLESMGADIEYERNGSDRLPLTVRGAALSSIDYTSEQASAQVKSAVLLAALTSGVQATVREPHRSRDHTERMLAGRGVAIELLGDGVRIGASQSIAPCDTDVPGDPSSAAFFAGLAALADRGSIRLENVCLNTTRTGFFEVLARMGARIEVEQQRLVGGESVGTVIVHTGTLTCVSVRGDEIPRCIDELPLVACLATRAAGETRISDASELRVKESDRIAAVVANLRVLGADAEELPDGMIVRGSSTPLRGTVRTHGDHRLAMAFGILAACPENQIVIDDPECVAVSFPTFWRDLAAVVKTVEKSSSDSIGIDTSPTSASTRAHDTPLVNKAVSEASANSTPTRASRLIIAIDGPAASGKSSTAQWVAQRLGVRHVDSGAFYRALTAVALDTGTEPDAWTPQSILDGSKRVGWQLTERSVAPLIDGESADEALRGTLVTRNVSRVASLGEVRDWVNAQVQDAAATADVVVDGRDIGTAVFPDAPLKVFLIADPWERARRRLVQRLGRLPTDPEIADETELLVARDALDATQSAPARDAITIDTTRLTQEEQVERIVALAKAAKERLVR